MDLTFCCFFRRMRPGKTIVLRHDKRVGRHMLATHRRGHTRLRLETKQVHDFWIDCPQLGAEVGPDTGATSSLPSPFFRSHALRLQVMTAAVIGLRQFGPDGACRPRRSTATVDRLTACSLWRDIQSLASRPSCGPDHPCEPHFGSYGRVALPSAPPVQRCTGHGQTQQRLHQSITLFCTPAAL